MYSLCHRELSRGQFSPDNQKLLSGPAIGIPIYEAKMTRDLRLIVSAERGHLVMMFTAEATKQYQTDCVPDFDSAVSRVVSHPSAFSHIIS
jgi:hypothetical protein